MNFEISVQARVPVGRTIMELPAGMLDDDAGDFVGTAAREVPSYHALPGIFLLCSHWFQAGICIFILYRIEFCICSHFIFESLLISRHFDV